MGKEDFYVKERVREIVGEGDRYSKRESGENTKIVREREREREIERERERGSS